MTLSYKTEQNARKLSDSLKKVLSDTFVLYFKTHSFHWNVEGPQFKALHEMFEEQYTALWQSTDEIAERIRTLGFYGPNSFKDLLGQTTLNETGQLPDAVEMAKQLANDNDAIVEQSVMPTLRLAEELGDEATVDMMVERI